MTSRARINKARLTPIAAGAPIASNASAKLASTTPMPPGNGNKKAIRTAVTTTMANRPIGTTNAQNTSELLRLGSLLT